MPINSFQSVLNVCSGDDAYHATCVQITRGKAYHPHSLADLWQELRFKKGRYLERDDLERVFSAENTHYGYYWKVPYRANWGGIKISLHESHRGNTALTIGQWKHKIAQKVYTKLQSMEVTSVVLSCVYPEDFAVYSPPTLTLLQVPPDEPIHHFLRYCDELRVWGEHFLDHYGISFADRALWVFYESTYGHRPDSKLKDAYRRAFETDEWIRERHASNMLRPYFAHYQPLQQARFLLGIDVYLAATVAGCEFESRLKQLVDPDEMHRTREIRRFQDQVLRTDPQSAKWGYLWSIIEYLAANKGYATQKDQLHEVRVLRNKAIHREQALTQGEAERMISVTEALPNQKAFHT